MKFWDASAVVPLVVSEPPSDALIGLLEADAAMVVWWGTPVEIASALARREREGALSADGATRALERLRSTARAWPRPCGRPTAWSSPRKGPCAAASGPGSRG